MCVCFLEELINLHRGQGRFHAERKKQGMCVLNVVIGMELFWRDTLTCPTEQEFLDMVNDSK